MYMVISDWLEGPMASATVDISHSCHNDSADDEEPCKLPDFAVPCSLWVYIYIW